MLGGRADEVAVDLDRQLAPVERTDQQRFSRAERSTWRWPATCACEESARQAIDGMSSGLVRLRTSAGEVAAVERRALGHLDAAVSEVGVWGARSGRATVTPSSGALTGDPTELGREPRRPEEVAAAEGRGRDPGVVVLAEPRLEPRVGVDALDDARVEADAGGEEEVAARRRAPRSTARGRQSSASASRCSVASTTSAGIPSIRQYTFARPPGQAGQRRAGAGQPVGGLVDGAVAAERDDRVVALVGGLAAELGGVVATLGVDRVDDVSCRAAQRRRGASAGRDGRRVRVDDHQQALACLVSAVAQVRRPVSRSRS